MDGVICGGYAFDARRVLFCPTEGRRRRFYASFAHYYGWTYTCLGCGDRWMDGERGSRPFARGWRVQAIRRAKERWAGVTVGARARRAAFRSMMADYFRDAGFGEAG
jgi:hypothetical protein